jgi:hypothetical protein
MCVFQSSLLGAVTHPHFLQDIDTLQKLDESGLPIVTLDPNLMNTFDESPDTGNLAAKLEHQNLPLHTLLHHITHYRNVSMLTSKDEALWYLSKYPNQLYITNQCPREYFVSYMIPKGSPYAIRIHNLLGKMSEAGLVTKWDLDTRYRLQLEGLREGRARIHDTRIITVFKLVEIETSFFVWGVGLAMSLMILLSEMGV